jgi:arylsulfatase A-like enzyme
MIGTNRLDLLIDINIMESIGKMIVCILWVGLSIIFSGCKNQEIKTDVKPNILFFLVDDQRNDMLSSAGHPILKTPTVDRLAQNGIRFTNAFVTTSICAASRASIITGLYESKHNYTFGKPPIKDEFTTESYPYILKKSGYTTGFVGKFGVKVQNRDSIIPKMFNYFKPAPKNAPYFETLSDGSKRHSAEIKGDQAIEFINNQTVDKPFCLSISFNAVHAVDGNKTPGNEGHYPYPYAVKDLYENIEMPRPKLSNPEIYKNHPDFLKESLNRERYFWRWDTKEKYQTNMRAYYRMISGYDNVMKRVIATLKEKGLDKNTIIIFAADNGYYMGSRGFAGKWSHYEESLRIPLVIYDPRISKDKTNSTSDKMVLNLDIPATILDYAGVAVPNLYQGQSLMPIANNEKIDSWRERFFCEHRMEHNKIPKYIGVREERYVYANYYEQNPPYEYLHDLKTDPNQLKNLIDNPAYKEVLERMKTASKSLETRIKF